jgi:hypothetical protein
MCFLALRQCSRSHRAKGFLSLKSGLAQCCGLLFVLIGAALLFLTPSETPLDTRGWKMSDFLEHLKYRGLELHVVPAAEQGRCDNVYLTEDPNATWASMQCKSMTLERIHQWHGVVSVEHTYPWIDRGHELAQWASYGCRIGDFILFGDAQILQRIREACSQQRGR